MPEQFLIDHCSPTLAGLKTANMFPVSLDEEQDIYDEVRKLNRMLHEKGIRIVVLRRTEKNALLYVYRPDYLDRDLGCPLARKILENRGYCCGSSGRCIVQLIRHMAEDGKFPHEVGLFLGYPPEDVRCFMQPENLLKSTCLTPELAEQSAKITRSTYFKGLDKKTENHYKKLMTGFVPFLLVLNLGRLGEKTEYMSKSSMFILLHFFLPILRLRKRRFIQDLGLLEN